MRAQEEPQYTPYSRADDDMDMDMDDYPPSSRHRPDPRDADPRERRDRHGMTPTTSGYGAEPSYPAYALGTQQGPYGSGQIPRSAAAAGNYSPSGGRSGQAYPPTTYDSRTSGGTVPSIPAPTQAYRDPKTGQLVTVGPDYGSGFGSEPTREPTREAARETKREVTRDVTRGSGRHR